MKILKASAGSGKTYNLAKEYITLLLKSESYDAYRHILAVTFTNKATDEMKRRILRELKVLATDPGRSPYIDDLVPAVLSTRGEVKQKAERMMVSILHDYGSFAISTIDKFFQQTLRAFSREIGQFTSYQVELDKDALVDDAVDRVLTGLGQEHGGNNPLLEWILRGVRSDLETTGRFTLDRRLKELAMSLVSEDPRETSYGREELEGLRDACDTQVSSFTDRIRAAANATIDAFGAAGVELSDTNRGFAKALIPYTQADDRELVLPPTPAFMSKAADPEKWFAKTKMTLLASCDGCFASMQEFCSLFGEPYKVYATAMTIRGQIYGLGVAGELRKAFVDAQKERGVISIEDTNTILHDIIDGTDTPFLYEKLGVRFENFLLDEFQDTSGIQWENFLPLLRNADASGGENLVVGDVKQSIYRWRGGEWDLLDNRLQKEFRVPADKITVLDGNYRTCKSIVGFNNSFFPYAAAEIDRLVGNAPASMESVQSIYGDVVQEVRTKDTAEGRVMVRFVDSTELEMDEIISAITDARSRGAHYKDIAVLVRGNAEGAAIAERLVSERISVISDDSLYVKSSVTVRRLISQLQLVDNPARAEGGSVEGFLAREMNIATPAQYHGLPDLAEALLSELKDAAPDLFNEETPFIQAFMDWLQEWTRKNGNTLAAMLADWEEANPKIAPPDGTDAVRIMTIHKSKGLEFPFVIFPFAEKVGLYKPTSYWCRPKVEGTPLERVAGKRYRTNLSESSIDTLFSEDYVRERSQQAIDNINVLYVALTRAKCELLVIGVKPTKVVAEAVAAGGPIPAKRMSDLLYAFVGNSDYSWGEPYDYGQLRREDNDSVPICLTYGVSAGNISRRMVFRTSVSDGDAQEETAAQPAQDMPQTTNQEIVEPTLF